MAELPEDEPLVIPAFLLEVNESPDIQGLVKGKMRKKTWRQTGRPCKYKPAPVGLLMNDLTEKEVIAYESKRVNE
jgi:hypothetical protein